MAKMTMREVDEVKVKSANNGLIITQYGTDGQGQWVEPIDTVVTGQEAELLKTKLGLAGNVAPEPPLTRTFDSSIFNVKEKAK